MTFWQAGASLQCAWSHEHRFLTKFVIRINKGIHSPIRILKSCLEGARFSQKICITSLCHHFFNKKITYLLYLVFTRGQALSHLQSRQPTHDTSSYPCTFSAPVFSSLWIQSTCVPRYALKTQKKKYGKA